jgi:hypothetical protein
MAYNTNSGNSLAEAVRNEISILPHIKTALSEGVVNYSALARKIMPMISEKLGKKLNEESVIVAIKRYADELDFTIKEPSHIDMFAESEVMLQDNMCYTHFKKTDKVIDKVDKLFAQEDWKMGEMRVLIQGADQVMIITKENRARDLLTELKGEIINSLSNNSLITFRMPVDSFSAYGVLAEMTSLLARKGISIELLSSPPDIHFLVHEKDAERAYSTLKQLINDSKKLVSKK